MTDETKKPTAIPGTWGAVVRSETPMPWRRMQEALSFTPEEFARGPDALVVRLIRTAGDMVKTETE